MSEINEQGERKNLDKATSYTGIWDRGEVVRGFKLISDSDMKQAVEFASHSRNYFKNVENCGEVKFSHEIDDNDRVIAQAQRDSCEKQHLERLQEIKAGIEALHHPQATNMRGISISRPEWESFWKGLGV